MQVYAETHTKTLYWRSYSTHEHTTVSLVLCLICQNLFKYSSVLYWWKSCKWSVNVIAIRVMSVVWYDTMCSDLTCTSVHPGQLSLAIPSWVGAMNTSQRAVMRCGWGVKAGVVRVWVAGKTVWSPCHTRVISERFRDKELIIKRYINSPSVLFYFLQ